ncbi:acyl-CoA N-acyltransferase, partial [Tribonema minus]
ASSAIVKSSNITVRLARSNDVASIRNINLRTLPENYTKDFYDNQLFQYPKLSLVAESSPDEDGRSMVVGYVLGQTKGLQPTWAGGSRGPFAAKEGHITSLAVAPEYRRQGIAMRLIAALHERLEGEHGSRDCSLHVRRSNASAVRLYRDVFGYGVASVERGYYTAGGGGGGARRGARAGAAGERGRRRGECVRACCAR